MLSNTLPAKHNVALILMYFDTFRQRAYVISCNFDGCKNSNFQIKNVICFLFCLKHRSWVRVPTIYVLKLKSEKTYTLVNPSFTI